jgi:hypothetical protein
MNFKPGTRIKVKPVVFYAKGVARVPSWHSLWWQFHLAAREKYRLLLKSRDTFELDDLIVLDGAFTPTQYKNMCFFNTEGLKTLDQLPEDQKDQCSNGVETILAEILHSDFDAVRYDRYTLPYCLSVLLVDPAKAWGAGGGRTLNGVANLGGGILVIPTWHFFPTIEPPSKGKLMSTLIHELGHTFGLLHTANHANPNNLTTRSTLFKCYYDLGTSHSIMSYNEANWTNSTDPEQIPGCLLGDDMEVLAQNKLVFPNLFFDKEKDFDCPPATSSCPPHDKITRPVYQGPMHQFWCTSSFGSHQGNIAHLNDQPGRWILSNHPEIGFVPDRMWLSGQANEAGWVSFDVTFPLPVTLNRIALYTQHSGQHDKASMIHIEREQTDGTFTVVKLMTGLDPDADITFGPFQAQRWRIALKAGPSGRVAVRGIRLFHDDVELSPPLGPLVITGFGATHGSKVSNLGEIQRVIRANTPGVGFDPRSMWHSDKVNEQGWVSIEMIFPTVVALDGLKVYSQHSGQFHRAKKVQIAAWAGSDEYSVVHAAVLSQPSKTVTFPKTQAKVWRLAFQGELGGHVVLRGLRFMLGKEEFYPPASVEKG